MKIKQSSIMFGVLAGSVLASALAPAAQAGTFGMSAQDIVDAACLGQEVCSSVGDDGFFTVTAGQQELFGDEVEQFKGLSAKDERGVLGIGVSSTPGSTVFNRYSGSSEMHDVQKTSDQGGDNVKSWGEIDKDEYLDIGFDGPAVLKQLDLSTMFQPGMHGDRVFESVKVMANVFGGGIVEGILTVTGDDTASWTVAGAAQAGASVMNLSPSTLGAGGSYSVSNLFGNSLLTGIRLASDYQRARGDYGIKDSDFTFSGIVVEQQSGVKGVSTPEPGTIGALFGLAAAAGLKLRRRPEGDAA
ncbi:MAG: PEP-CTERM sorting domain-containing protein [Cyanobacteriota bacterium]|nr:PEP-CTERM sorting domain-containing protein [Cyanobacteriota bacterium]